MKLDTASENTIVTVAVSPFNNWLGLITNDDTVGDTESTTLTILVAVEELPEASVAV